MSVRSTKPYLKVSILGALALALAITLCQSQVSAAQQTLLHPDPPSLGLKSGEQGSISILVDAAQNMYGIEFHLKFDPNLVEVVDADPSKAGVQIKPGDWLKNTFVASNKADNGAGTIDYAVTLLNPAPAVSGSGTVAAITFKAKGNGTSPLKVQKAILASRDGKEIKSSWQDGAIGVSPLGIAPSVDQTARTGSESTDSTQPSQALPTREIVLLGAAGLGVVVFFGALALAVVAFVVFRRR
jgi:hypothetical protein